jgi:hypothetical protein
VHAPPYEVATVVIVIVVIEAEAYEAVIEVAIMISAAKAVVIAKSAAVMIVEAAVVDPGETTTAEAARRPGCVETTATHTGHAAVDAATTKAAHAASMEATPATKATASSVATSASATSAASTSAATSQHHCWRSQANGRNCQQRDNRLAQHDHSPSEISHPAQRSL